MQRLEVSGAVRPLYGSLDVKGLMRVIYEIMWKTTVERDRSQMTT
jgi:hypothetical protein